MGSPEDSSKKFGLVKRRVCRDVIFLLLFIIYWVAMIIVAATAIGNGDLKQLTVPKDSLGNFCGDENAKLNGSYANQTSQPYLYYLDPFQAGQPNASSICISSCPNTTELLLSSPQKMPCVYGIVADILTARDLIDTQKCSPYIYSSAPVLNRCVPIASIPEEMVNETISIGNTKISLSEILSSGKSTVMQVVADFKETWKVFAAAAGTAIILSFVWLFIAQYIIGLFVWLSITLVNLIGIACSVLLYFYWQSRLTSFKTGTGASGVASLNIPGIGSVNQTIPFLDTKTPAKEQEVTVAMVIFIVFAVVASLILLITIAMIKRIRMAIQIINEAALAFRKLPGVIFMPIFFSLVHLALFAYFIIVGLFLLTPVKPPVIQIASLKWVDPNLSTYMMWFHLAGFIWTFFTLVGLSQVTVAGAVGEWYWQVDKSTKLRLPVLRSFGRAVFYHLGSIVLGAFLITIVEIIRILLYQLQRQVSRSKSEYLKYLVACAQCCMKVVEMVMKFINRNAYVYIAISGQAFFKSAGAATALLLKNAAKTFAVSYVGDVALLMAKLVVVGINTLAAYFFLMYNTSIFPLAISSPSITIGIVAFETFLVASFFFSNYSIAIDTIFLSVLEDLDKNDGSQQRPYFMSDSMKKILNRKVN
ncbi:plasma-membrane choline transporter-domain-containing protein [Globomyces pollinis-pini]|nr:plasma-membrane choline transporter-domain-containing protein [Globomyces pollinis-pini]